MNISLNTNFERFIHEKVEEGYYNPASEVVREALRLLMEKETYSKQQIEKLNNEINLGLSQLSMGQGIEGEKIFQEIKSLRNSQNFKWLPSFN